MPNTYFQFKQFRIEQEHAGMKVTTDGCLFGAWVAQQLSIAEPKRLLDIGSGTGLLSLMIAQATSQTQIESVDINEAAFQETIFNFRQSPWQNRLSALKLPVQQFQPKHAYDCIMCNPPFFKGSTPGEQAARNQAIHANDLTSDVLLKEVTRLLDNDGQLFILYPEREMDTFIQQAKVHSLLPSEVVTVQNQAEHPIFRKMALFTFQDTDLKEDEIILKQPVGKKYTEQAWKLLQPYYLEYNDPNL